MQALLHSVPPTLQQATADPCLHWRLLDTHGQVWVSLLWGHCSFLLGPGEHRVLCVPSQSLFPQSCVSSGSSVVGSMATSSKRAYVIPRSAASRAPAPAAAHCCLHQRHSHTLLSLCGSLGPGAQVLFEPSECLWQVWGLILNMLSPLLPSCWASPLPLDMGYLFSHSSATTIYSIITIYQYCSWLWRCDKLRVCLCFGLISKEWAGSSKQSPCLIWCLSTAFSIVPDSLEMHSKCLLSAKFRNWMKSSPSYGMSDSSPPSTTWASPFSVSLLQWSFIMIVRLQIVTHHLKEKCRIPLE